MHNTYIAPATIEEMLEELGNSENIIVLEGERKLYVPVGALDDSLETTCAKYIMITDGKESAQNISALEAFAQIQSSYLRTVA